MISPRTSTDRIFQMAKFKVSKTSIGCGTGATAILTVLSSFDWFPTNLREPQVMIALNGLIVTLASAFQICDLTVNGRRSRSTTEEKSE